MDNYVEREVERAKKWKEDNSFQDIEVDTSLLDDLDCLL